MNSVCLVAWISCEFLVRLPSSATAGGHVPIWLKTSYRATFIDLIRIEGPGSKVIAKPFTGVVVLGMIFLLKCFK
jgi:hypothetical protein